MTETNPRITLDYWRRLTRSSVSGPSDDLVERIAAFCVKSEESGKPAAVWHALAQVTGRPERCNCHPCRRSRGEEGRSPFRYRSC